MGTPYVGEIRMFSGNFAPADWALCQGQSLAISDYEILYNLIGTTYGGDGVQSFNLPNLQGRIPVHQGSGSILGQSGGEEQVTLYSTQQLPSHSHPFYATSANGDQNSPANALFANAPSGSNLYFQSTAPGPGLMSMLFLSSSGGNQPHDNMMPFLAVNFIISLYGIYPTQS